MKGDMATAVKGDSIVSVAADELRNGDTPMRRGGVRGVIPDNMSYP
ncbi:MAG: hypothetical protein JXL20_02495 [Deltaproteobacteria bacterium]|nr:hypothetical protein [Deltaproteobacteria bacterium]